MPPQPLRSIILYKPIRARLENSLTRAAVLQMSAGLKFRLEVGYPSGSRPDARHKFEISIGAMAVCNSRRYLQCCVGLDWRLFLAQTGFDVLLKEEFFSAVATRFVKRHERLIPFEERDGLDLFPRLAHGLSAFSRVIPLAFVPDWFEVANLCYQQDFRQGLFVFTPALTVEHQALGMVEYLPMIGLAGPAAASEMQSWFDARRRVQTDMDQIVSTVSRVSGSLDVVEQQQAVLDELGRRMETVHNEHQIFAARYGEEQQGVRELAAMEARRSAEQVAKRQCAELKEAYETLQMQIASMRQWMAARQSGGDDDSRAATPDRLADLYEAERGSINAREFGHMFEDLPLAPAAAREDVVRSSEELHAIGRMRAFSHCIEFPNVNPLVDDFRTALERSSTDVRAAAADAAVAAQLAHAERTYANEICAYQKTQIYPDE